MTYLVFAHGVRFTVYGIARGFHWELNVHSRPALVSRPLRAVQTRRRGVGLGRNKLKTGVQSSLQRALH